MVGAAALPALRREGGYGRAVRALREAGGRAPLLAGLAGTVLFSGAYAAVISNRAFPLTEGWWSVFAKYINEGKAPYRDFELLTTPVYAYLIAGVTAVFGYDIMVLRVLGVLTFTAIAALAYLIFARLARPGIAVVTACLTALYMQSEVNSVLYDYIRFFDLFTYAAALCLLVYVSGIGRPAAPRISWAITLCGLSSGAAILTRQSSGLVDAAYIVAVLAAVTIAIDRRGGLANLANYVVSTLAPVGLAVGIMLSNGSFSGFLEATTGSALAAKGGTAVVLTAWVGRTVPAMVGQVVPIMLLFDLLLLSGLLFARHHREADAGTDRPGRRGVLFLSAAAIAIILCLSVEPLAAALASAGRALWPEAVYPVAVLLFAGGLLSLARRDRLAPEHRAVQLQVVALAGMTVAIGYGSVTSAALSPGQTALALGTIFTTVLLLCRGRLGGPVSAFAVGLAVLLCVSCAAYKIEHPYYWWGLEEPSGFAATESVDSPLLAGVLVSHQTRVAIEGVTHAITANSQPGDNVLAFPNIPIFYLLADRYPRTFAVVQWFDFSSAGTLASDTGRIEGDPPRVIVMAGVPEQAFDAHENLFNGGQESATRRMRDALTALIAERQYRLVGSFALYGDYPINVWAIGP